MYKQNNPHHRHRCSESAAVKPERPLLLAGLVAAMLWQLFPTASWASLETTAEAPSMAVQARPLPAAKTARGGYQVRCWQHGRLLFEENNVTLPADGSRYALKLSGSDGNGRPLYVAETQNATCLVRHAPSAVANPGLPR